MPVPKPLESSAEAELRPIAPIAFLAFHLDVEQRTLTRSGIAIAVPTKAMDVLVYLVLHRDRVVGRAELVDKVWPGTFVEPNNLDQAISALRKCLGRDADGRSPIETIPRQGYRFAAALEILNPVQPNPQPIEPAPPAVIVTTPREIRGLWWLVGVLCGLIVAIAVSIWVSKSVRTQPAIAPSRKSIAVLAPSNLSGTASFDWIATALAHTLTSELSASEQFRTVPAESVARMQTEMGTMPGPDLRAETLAGIRRNLTADYVITGSYLPVANRIRVDLFLQDASRGESLGTVSLEDDQDQLLKLVSRAGSELRQRLGARPLTVKEANGFRAAVARNPSAMRQYALGQERLRLLDASGAIGFFEVGIAADPDYPLAHAALSEAWTQLGYDTKARDEAKKAMDLAAGLSREDRLGVEARYYRVTTDWPKALETANVLWRFFPDNVEYGLMLAEMQLQSGQVKQALVTVQGLAQPGLPFANDSRIPLLMASIKTSLADFAGAASAADQAALAGQERRAYRLRAQALFEGGTALFHLGKTAEAQAKLAAARQIFESSKDLGSVEQVMQFDAQLLLSKGEIASGKHELEEVLASSRKRGDRRRSATALWRLGGALRTEGDMASARLRLEEALEIVRDTGDEGLEAKIQLGLGNILNNTGHPQEGRRGYEQAQYLADKTGDRATLATALGNLGILDYVQGDLAIAVEKFNRCLKLKREIGDRSSVAYTLSHLATVKEWQDDLEAARKLRQEVCATYESLGERARLNECHINSADLAINFGQASEFQGELERLASSSELPSPGSAAYRVLAEYWLSIGDSVKARAAIEQAQRIVKKSVNEADFLIPTALTAAQVDAASGRTAAALASLTRSLKRAEEIGAVNLQFQARLNIGQIEIRTGAQSNGEAHLMALERDALARGFLHIARLARASAKGR